MLEHSDVDAAVFALLEHVDWFLDGFIAGVPPSCRRTTDNFNGRLCTKSARGLSVGVVGVVDVSHWAISSGASGRGLLCVSVLAALAFSLQAAIDQERNDRLARGRDCGPLAVGAHPVVELLLEPVGSHYRALGRYGKSPSPDLTICRPVADESQTCQAQYLSGHVSGWHHSGHGWRVSAVRMARQAPGKPAGARVEDYG